MLQPHRCLPVSSIQTPSPVGAFCLLWPVPYFILRFSLDASSPLKFCLISFTGTGVVLRALKTLTLYLTYGSYCVSVCPLRSIFAKSGGASPLVTSAPLTWSLNSEITICWVNEQSRLVFLPWVCIHSLYERLLHRLADWKAAQKVAPLRDRLVRTSLGSWQVIQAILNMMLRSALQQFLITVSIAAPPSMIAFPFCDFLSSLMWQPLRWLLWSGRISCEDKYLTWQDLSFAVPPLSE